MANKPWADYAPWVQLRHARLRAGHTATSAAKAIGTTLSNYCAAEKGVHGFSDERFFRVAKLFKVDVVELDRTRPGRRGTNIADVA